MQILTIKKMQIQNNASLNAFSNASPMKNKIRILTHKSRNNYSATNSHHFITDALKFEHEGVLKNPDFAKSRIPYDVKG